MNKKLEKKIIGQVEKFLAESKSFLNAGFTYGTMVGMSGKFQTRDETVEDPPRGACLIGALAWGYHAEENHHPLDAVAERFGINWDDAHNLMFGYMEHNAFVAEGDFGALGARIKKEYYETAESAS